MGSTKKANYEKAIKLLLENDISQATIDEKLNGKSKNKEKYEALLPLLTEKELSIDNLSKKEVVDKSPTLQSFFGKIVSDLLIKRKALSEIKSINIESIGSKTINDLTADDYIEVIKYQEYELARKKILEIDSLLLKKGIKYAPEEKLKEKKVVEEEVEKIEEQKV